MSYVRRGAQVETNLGQTVNKSSSSFEANYNITVTNIVTRDIKLEEDEEAIEESPVSKIVDERPHLGYTAKELWTIPVLKKVISAINNSYFNTKLIDNIIMLDDMESILSAVTGFPVTITTMEPADKCACLKKIACIRDISKITVNDNGTTLNFKYQFNDVYESMADDFRINMTKVFIRP